MWHKLILAGFFLVPVMLVAAQGTGLGLPGDVTEYFTWERANAQKSFEESAHPVAKDIYMNELAAETARVLVSLRRGQHLRQRVCRPRDAFGHGSIGDAQGCWL